MNPPPTADAERALAQPAAMVAHPSAAAWGALLATRGDGLALKDIASGRYLHANEVLLTWMGRAVSEVIGHTDAELFDAGTGAALRAADQAAMAQAQPMAAEHRVTFDGRPRELALWRLVCAATDAVSPPCLLSVWTDLAGQRQHDAQLRAALAQIEQLQGANESMRRELADQALRDPASGLYTRAHFEDQLRREVDLSGREHREFSIVFVEIDEEPTARPGAAKAAVQAALGRLLRSGTRAMDASCRLDEKRFAVLLSGVGLATAHSRMEGLRRRCATEIVVHEGRELRFSVAMGVASFPHTAHSQEELAEACTAALHEAQRRGGNHVALAAIRFEPA